MKSTNALTTSVLLLSVLALAPVPMTRAAVEPPAAAATTATTATTANSDMYIQEHFGAPSYQHSLYVPLMHSTYDNEYWDFGGSAVVKVYDSVRLTTDQPSQKGYLWTKTPIQSNSWSVEFEFKIDGKNSHVYGDGFAFWFVSDKYKEGTFGRNVFTVGSNQLGPVFGSIDNFKGLGIFFDTFANSEHQYAFPYISAMVGDGNKGYDHDGDNTKSAAGHGCEANVRANEELLKARVTYYKNKVLELEFTDDSGVWHKCFTLPSIELPHQGYLGFSAETGAVSDTHEILKVTTYTQMKDEMFQGQADAVNGSSFGTGSGVGSWFLWLLVSLLKLGGVGAIVGGAYYVYTKKIKPQNMKTF